VAMPVAVLQALLVLTSGLALARALGWWMPRPPASALFPAGMAIGAAAATTGSAGLAVSAVLQSSGRTGGPYIATAPATAIAIHVGRIAGYGAGGLFTAEAGLQSAILAAAILAGNLAGGRIRHLLAANTCTRLELGVLLGCVALALVGLA